MKAFSQEHGHALINSTETYNGYPLGAWAALQRRDGRTGSLSVERRKKLESLAGWVWEVVDLRWDEAVKRLLDYVDEYGDSLVPQPYTSPDGFRLGAWVNFQRARQRRESWNQIGQAGLLRFPDGSGLPETPSGQSAFQILKRFAEEHGNVVVPISHPSTTVVSTSGHGSPTSAPSSTGSARRASSYCGLCPAGIRQVMTAGGNWASNFYGGTSPIPEPRRWSARASSTASHWARWAMTRRLEYKRGELDSDRVKLLSALPGWDWDRRGGKWEDGFIRLQNYLEAHGRMPPLDYVEDNGYRLGAWAQQQRHLRKKGTLAVGRISRLDAIDGWKWDPRARSSGMRASLGSSAMCALTATSRQRNMSMKMDIAWDHGWRDSAAFIDTGA